jgi:hypothetical protein
LLLQTNERCSYWSLEVNDGPYDPISGTAGSLLASMGSIAVGFGTMLAAPSKALYAVAVKGIKGCDADTSSIRSDGSGRSSIKSAKQSLAQGGTSMEKTHSDQSSGSRPHATHVDSMEYKQLKRGFGAKGLGRVLRTVGEGIISTCLH